MIVCVCDNIWVYDVRVRVGTCTMMSDDTF